MFNSDYNVIIVGTGPAGLGAAFHLTEQALHGPAESGLRRDYAGELMGVNPHNSSCEGQSRR